MSATIEQKIEALRRARKHSALDAGICMALTSVAAEAPRLGQAAYAVKEYIQRALGGVSYLEGWLQLTHPVDGLYYYDTEHEPRMLRTRLAWIDWMIACYEQDLAKQKGGPS